MRCSMGLWLLLLMLAATPEARSELKQVAWPNREIQIEAEADDAEPPVVTALGLQRGGKLMASAGDDHLVRVWNRETGEMIARLDGHIDWIRTAAFTPDGTELITAGNDRRIYRWDVENQWTRTMLAEHSQAIVALAIHPAGDQIAVVGFDGQMHVYNMAGETLATWGCPCRDMRTVVYSPNGEQIAAAGRNGKIRVYDSSNGDEIVTIEAHRQRIRALVYTPDGQQLISASEDRTIKGWNPITGVEQFMLSSGPAKVQSLALYGEGKLASAGSDNRIRLWDLRTLSSEQYLHGHTGSIVAMESDGHVLVSGAYDATIRIWQISDDVAAAEQTLPVNVGFLPREDDYQPPKPNYQAVEETNKPTESTYKPLEAPTQPGSSRYLP